MLPSAARATHVCFCGNLGVHEAGSRPIAPSLVGFGWVGAFLFFVVLYAPLLARVEANPSGQLLYEI